MSYQIQSLALMILGILVVAISLLADVIGMGAEPGIIGWKQYSGAAVGVFIILFGAHLAIHHTLRKQR